jgi:hypothetical protein
MDTKTQWEENQKETDDLGKITAFIKARIRGDIDSIRARGVWKKILADMPADTIAEALTTEINHHVYQEIPRCHCRGCK